MKHSYIAKITARGAAAIMLILGIGNVAAQELTLFERVETPETETLSDQGPNREERAAVSEPEFTLIGTSRIGNKVRATLRARSGEILKVEGAPGSALQIPGYGGFQMTDVQSRHVSINYPSSTVCVEFADKGVRCPSGNTASLSLTTAAPIEVAQNTVRDGRATRMVGDDDNVVQIETTEEGEPLNPFAAALRAAAQESPDDIARRRAEAQRFQIRRIDPSEVPPGQRVVRTPFGDRLVEQ